MVEAIRQGDIPGVQLRVRQRLRGSPDEAWRWLVESSRLERWACDRAEVDPGPSGYLVLERETTDAGVRERGETLELRAPRLWALSFERLESGWKGPTRLTLELAPAPEGAELSIFHEGFEHLSLSICLTVWEQYRLRWRRACERLADQIEPVS